MKTAWKDARVNLLAHTKGDFERQIERGVLVEALDGLHAQVAVAGLLGARLICVLQPAAVARHGLQMAPAGEVRLAADHRPLAGALVDRVHAARRRRQGRRRRRLLRAWYNRQRIRTPTLELITGLSVNNAADFLKDSMSCSVPRRKEGPLRPDCTPCLSDGVQRASARPLALRTEEKKARQ